MSWASEKAAEIFRWGRPTREEPFGVNRYATIEHAIKETIEECARQCDDTDDNHVGQALKARILAMLENA